MQKLFLFFSLVILSLSFLNAQKTNLIFFTEQGEHFSVLLNGILQNPKPETNVKVTDLPALNYTVKIIFEDPKLGKIDKNLMFDQGTETTFCIKKNDKGEFALRFINEIPLIDEPPFTNKPYVLLGYNGLVGCPYPMEPQDFSAAKNTIASKSFEDSKLSIAKQIINTNCLLSSQVKEIMLLFSFEDTRLDFAKYAYGYTYDLGNYYVLNDVFKFESSVNELNQFINSIKK